MFDIAKVRKDFPVLNRIDPVIYLDSGATSLKPQCVIDTVVDYYTNHSVNIHRGDYDMSFKVSELYDKARLNIASFINANADEIIFTSGATAALNLAALQFGARVLNEGDVILTTESEHASNILPLFHIAKLKKAKIEYVTLTDEGALTLSNFKKAMHDKVKLVAITHVSNVVGYISPIKEIAAVTHEHDAYIIVDGAQSVPHIPVDVKALDVDFLAFSGHKMLSPTGVGVLYGKKELLAMIDPLFYGGGSNARFDRDGNVILKSTPDKFEAGTPAIEGVLGLSKAVDYLKALKMENIALYEDELRQYLIRELKNLSNVIVYNPHATGGIIALNVKDIFSQDAAAYLNAHNIAVRAGNHCAKILKGVLKTDDTIRCSLYFYNTKAEIDEFVKRLKEVTIENCINLII